MAGASARAGLKRWLRRPLGERIAERAGDLDLTLIRASSERDGAEQAPLDRTLPRNAWREALSTARERRSPPRAYGFALAICAAITLLASQLIDHIDLTNLVMLYLLGVIFTAREARARAGRACCRS